MTVTTKKVRFIKQLTVENKPFHLRYQVEGVGIVDFDCKSVPQEVQDQAMVHGFNQKIRDSAAGFGNLDRQGAYNAMMEVVGFLPNGWNKGTTNQGIRYGEYLAEALFKTLKGTKGERDMAWCEEKVGPTAPKENRLKVANRPDVQAHLLRIVADAMKEKAKSAPKDELDALLDSLDVKESTETSTESAK